MTDKSSLPVFFYAIASLAALVIMPVLALILSGAIGFFYCARSPDAPANFDGRVSIGCDTSIVI